MTVVLHTQRMVPLGQLHLADYNPRDMHPAEMEKLKRSLREFGFVEPVVAREEDGLVIGGHQRIAAMRAILTETGNANIDAALIPVVFLKGVGDDRAKLLNLALNRIHGEWDYQKLADVLDSLQTLSLDDRSLAGFDVPEVEDILALLGPQANAPLPLDPEIDPDEALRREARKFVFEVASDEETALCDIALRGYGKTGPGNAADAFVRAMRAAQERLNATVNHP